jgi:hypothetical protein
VSVLLKFDGFAEDVSVLLKMWRFCWRCDGVAEDVTVLLRMGRCFRRHGCLILCLCGFRGALFVEWWEMLPTKQCSCYVAVAGTELNVLPDRTLWIFQQQYLQWASDVHADTRSY